MVNCYVYDEKEQLPLVYEAASGTLFEDWLTEAGEELEANLLKHGAVLLRGFGIDRAEVFAVATKRLGASLLAYVDGNSPRTSLGQGIYTSTEFPPEFQISMHNELSYSSAYPRRLFFCCAIAPAGGGSTLLADGRALLQSLDGELVAAFEKKRVHYYRNLHDGYGYGPSWQETFETEDRDEVTAFCRKSKIDFHWSDDGILRISQLGPAVVVHPKTGERVWFNQADQFHPSSHPPDYQAALMEIYEGRHQEMPTFATFGDDSLIPDAMLNEIRAGFAAHTVAFPWQVGDFLLVDNLLCAHGRAPFEGPRKVLVAMC